MLYLFFAPMMRRGQMDQERGAFGQHPRTEMTGMTEETMDVLRDGKRRKGSKNSFCSSVKWI